MQAGRLNVAGAAGECPICLTAEKKNSLDNCTKEKSPKEWVN